MIGDYMIMILSIWILCGIIAVMVANSKGERNILILLFCSLIGPIGLAYILTRKKKMKIYCPYCDENVDTLGGDCSLCGLKLEPIDGNGESITSKQCPKCEKSDVHDAYIENGLWGKWCPNCKMSIKKIRKSKA
jgi:hypothetical protein